MTKGRLTWLAAFLNWTRISLSKSGLMPVWVCNLNFARRVELCDLIFAQIPSNGAQILAELLFVSGADNQS